MNPASIGKARKLFLDIRDLYGHRKNSIQAVVAPPFPFISEIERLSPSQRIGLAAQDVFFESTGAYTGEVSLSMLRSVGVNYVIVGHSERRARGETDDDIYKDVQIVLKNKTTAVVCVGEQVRDNQGNYFGVVEAQIRAALRDVKKTQLQYVVLAYEPIWAIGTGKTATPEDVREMRLFIEKLLTDRFDRSSAKRIRILYGGSVKKSNTENLLQTGEVDGFLVGGASLRPTEFVSILNTVVEHVKKYKST